QGLFLRIFLNHVHHLGNGDTPDQAVLIVGNGCGYKIVAFECARCVGIRVEWIKGQEVGSHDFGDVQFGLADKQAGDGQGAAQLVVPVDNEDLVGVVGQFVQPA